MAKGIVLSQSVQAIDAAGIVLQTAESEDMNQEEYEKLLTQYATTAVNPIQAINGVSENLLHFTMWAVRGDLQMLNSPKWQGEEH